MLITKNQNSYYYRKKINTEKCIGTYTDITVQEILEVRHSQFEILTDNLLLWF
jgi:hypothetical protein